MPDDLPSVETELRERAKEEIAATIGVTLGEYVDPEADPKEWDLRGLSEWAASRFGVDVSINHLRRLSPEEMSEFLIQAAQERVDQVDLSPLGAFLEPDFAPRSLAEWARSRFGVELTPQELSVEDRRQAEELIQQAVEATYLRREIEYPPEYAIDITVGQAGVDNAYAVAALVAWVNRKYQAGWTAERLLGKTVEQVRGELVELSERFFTGGELEGAVDAFIGGRAEADIPAEEVATFARERFDTAVDPAQVQTEGVREFLVRVGRAYLRRELSELERYVLLQIYDASWIDHLLGMDHLKQGVGLRGFAEQDPKIAYKKEGYRQFQEMLKGVREKVTDMIFKVRLAPEEGGAAAGGLGRYQVSNLVHDQLTAYDNLAQDMAAQQQAAQAAGQTRVQPIIRQEPRVGRNDPCPCGSGKKYKKCCGKGL